jgi:hypothetical protein
MLNQFAVTISTAAPERLRNVAHAGDFLRVGLISSALSDLR